MSPSMQRYMRAQTVASGEGFGGLDSMNKVCMEINPNHPIIKDLNRMVKANTPDKETEDYAKLLFDVAGMTSGYDIDDMSSFARRVMQLMSSQSANTVPDAEIVGEDKDASEDESIDEKKTTADVEVLE